MTTLRNLCDCIGGPIADHNPRESLTLMVDGMEIAVVKHKKGGWRAYTEACNDPDSHSTRRHKTPEAAADALWRLITTGVEEVSG